MLGQRGSVRQADRRKYLCAGCKSEFGSVQQVCRESVMRTGCGEDGQDARHAESKSVRLEQRKDSMQSNRKAGRKAGRG